MGLAATFLGPGGHEGDSMLWASTESELAPLSARRVVFPSHTLKEVRPTQTQMLSGWWRSGEGCRKSEWLGVSCRGNGRRVFWECDRLVGGSDVRDVGVHVCVVRD